MTAHDCAEDATLRPEGLDIQTQNKELAAYEPLFPARPPTRMG